MLSNEFLAVAMAAAPELVERALRVLKGEGSQGATKCEPFVTASSVSRLTGISRSTLWRWKLPGHVLGGRKRYRMGEVLAYLESPAFKALAASISTVQKGVKSE
jgi:predicted DNA-binding transcriptional regulator AlpA